MRLGIIVLVVAMTNIAVQAKTGERLRAEYFGGIRSLDFDRYAAKAPPSTIIPRVGESDASAMDSGMIMKTSSIYKTCTKGYNLNGANGWCAGKSDKNQYVQFNSIIPVKWVAVATQPRTPANQYVKTFKIQYTKNGKDWKYYKY